MAKKLAAAYAAVTEAHKAHEDALNAAEAALTDHVEQMLTELAKRFPRRRFYASSGMGSLSIEVYPGPKPRYAHHPRQPYKWFWGGMWGPDNTWRFLWQDWEDLLDSFIKETGQTANDYVNFTRELDVRGTRYKD
jgi:hypothetical protein